MRSVVLTGWVAAALCLAACQHPAGPGGPQDPGEVGGPVAFHTDAAEGGDAARLQGTVEIGSTCIVVVDPQGTRYLPVFHRGDASGDADELTYAGQSYADGAEIVLAGGESADPAASADHVPEDCGYDLGWYVAS